MRINTNLTAMNTFTQYTNNAKNVSNAVKKLSSGFDINSAADNAAGLAISEKMRAQIRGLDQSSSNAQDAISLVQTAEGALGKSEEILQRMREIAVQSSSDTNQNEIDRTALQDEFSQLQGELNDIAKTTTFNKKNLLDGSLSKQNMNLGTTSLGNSGMTIDLGNVSTGTYNFSVTTKLESSAVDGVKPTTAELVKDGADTYFGGTYASTSTKTVEFGSDVKASSLLNGNYTLSASYSDPTNDSGDGQIKVTATGDNGQTFQATITADTLKGLTSDNSEFAITFNADAKDAFTVNLSLKSGISASENNFDTLAENIGKLSVSVSGGVTAKEAEYGVYANLTGATSVKLSSGMNSVTFDNGVKVNFGTLTASSVDTTNNASIQNTVGTAITDATTTWSNLKAADSSTISNGAMKITSKLDAATGIVTFTAKDDTNATYTATAKAADLVSTLDATDTLTKLKFTDQAGADAFSLDYTTHTTAAATGAFTEDTTGIDVTVTGAGHNYTKVFGNATGADTISQSSMTAAADTSSVTLSNMVVENNATVAAGTMTFTSAANGTTATNSDITATDANGNTFTCTLTAAQLGAVVEDTAIATANPVNMTFKDAAGNNAFTVDLSTMAKGAKVGAALGVSEISGNISLTNDLSASTASNFSVEATKNAGLTFQVGANEGDEMAINIDKMDANYLGVASANVSTLDGASAAITAVDDAINQVSAQRAYLGAIQNRLDYKIDNLNTSSQNLTSAESQIRDVDMAKQMTEFTNANILQQAATSMLAQANNLPQNVLKLLG